ncbi:branched-chain amino acid ABC transporter permease [Noviherbaspirillum sp. CPCC 100848]|uniref:Branched-chain amino acid ABC transporter permease n=1 Tax=Noviherbaspirillum album TaxID=3080276 RepID=A0ABU6JGN4_9BURK|nr:branched-chain amino acid ABC transporter permease [Noviherbaspirillum sp. CPCC 100848]MEC4722824.1 branched-chain amino acid ABC transporter permease [Noviherbaspirillum sp. CPCC 100848]
MNSSTILLALLDGTTQAALLALVALGLTLIFGVMGIVNVAHGSFYAFGGYAAAKISAIIASGDSIPMSLIALVIGALLMGLLLGAVIETGLIRRILTMDPVMQLLSTFAVFMIMEDLQRLIWGASPVSVTHAVDAMGSVQVGDVTYTTYQLILLPSAAIAVFVGLRWFLSHTRFGRQIMAVTHHREVASAMGINVKRVGLLTFCLGAVMGTLGGALASPTTSLMPGLGGDMMVLSFAVVAVAGLGQITGTAVAALLIGLGKAFSVYLLPELDVLVPYLIMLAVLLWRPQGLFAVTESRRV